MSDFEVKYSYEDVPTIERFSNSDKFIREIMGPFGSGKSSGCVAEIFQRAWRQVPGKDGIRKTRWVVIRNSYPQLKDTTIKTFHDWFPPKYCGTWKQTDHDYIIDAWKGMEMEVMFRALDKPDDVAKLLSLEVTGAWLNEVREIPKSIFDGIQGRVCRYPAVKDGGCTWGGVIMDTNPPDTDHWLYKLMEETRPENAELFRQPPGRSPEAENIPNLPRNYYNNLAIGKDIEYVKVYVDGEYGYVQDGKPVHPNFKDSIHVAKKDLVPLKGLPLILGFDFGLTPAVGVCQLTPRGGFIVLEEFVSEDMGIRRLIRDIVKPALLTRYRDFKVRGLGDPSGNVRVQTDERTCFMEIKAAGIPIQMAPTNSLVARTEAINGFLNKIVDGKPAFLISPKCKVLRKGLNGGYKFRRLKIVGDDKYTDRPEKSIYSHICEAVQYAAMDADVDIMKGERSVRSQHRQPDPPPSAQGWT